MLESLSLTSVEMTSNILPDLTFYIFDSLKRACENVNLNEPLSPGNGHRQWTIILEEVDKSIVSNSEQRQSQSFFHFYGFKAAIFSGLEGEDNQNDKYFVFTGNLDFQNIDADYLDHFGSSKSFRGEYSITPGCFLSLAKRIQLPVRSGDSEFYRSILDTVDFRTDNLNPNAFDVRDLYHFFDSIEIWKIPSNSVFTSQYEFDIARISLFVLVNCDNLTTLSFNSDTKNAFKSICVDTQYTTPFDNILNAYISFDWRYCFLSIYRCIEKLFPISKLKPAYERTRSNLSFFDFCKEIEDQLKWKPVEADAIRFLFKSIDMDNSQEDGRLNLIQAKRTCRERGLDQSEDNTANSKFIYMLRNNIVHYRPLHQNIELDDEVWNSIIQFLLKVVFDLYGRYHNDLTLYDNEPEQAEPELS